MKVTTPVLHEHRTPFRLEQVDLADPKADEVRVRMQACGVCASDWHVVTGGTKQPLPCAVGHEGVGVVEAVGPGVTALAPGDRVALSWAPGCGQCFQCRRSRPALCERYVGPLMAATLLDGTTRYALDGQPVHHYCGIACLSERAVVPVAACVPCPEDVPSTVAALVGCAVTTGFGAAVITAGVQPDESVVVYGAGGVGLSAVMGARHARAGTLIAIDQTAERAGRGEAFGATDALVDGDAIVAQVRERTGGRGADVVIDTTGVPAVQRRCVDLARPGGRVVLVGLAPMGATIPVEPAALTREEKTIAGCYYGSSDPPRDFPRILELYREGRLPLDRLITRTYALDQVNEAYADLVAGKLLRGVVEIS